MAVPAWLHSSSDAPDGPQSVAVAIRRFGAGHFHTGVIFRPEDAQPAKLLHLASHLDLRLEPGVGKYWWVVPRVQAERSLIVEEFCRLIWERHRESGLPYGFTAGAWFSVDASLNLDPPSVGMTCATFVVEIFRQCGIDLLAEEEWPSRRSDGHARNRIIESMRGRVEGQHLEALSAELPAARFRPVEVAGACLFEQPAAFLPSMRAGWCIGRVLRRRS